MITPNFACAYYDIDMVVIRRYVMFGIMLCLALCYVWHHVVFGIMLRLVCLIYWTTVSAVVFPGSLNSMLTCGCSGLPWPTVSVAVVPGSLIGRTTCERSGLPWLT